jgi:hypothetical protein
MCCAYQTHKKLNLLNIEICRDRSHLNHFSGNELSHLSVKFRKSKFYQILFLCLGRSERIFSFNIMPIYLYVIVNLTDKIF